jgi:K+-sensing histidine kinase KdpD
MTQETIQSIQESRRSILLFLDRTLNYDVRTPTNTITGYVRFLTKSLADRLTEEEKKAFESIKFAGEEITKIISVTQVAVRAEFRKDEVSPIVETDLNPILIKNISKIQARIKYENSIIADLRQQPNTQLWRDGLPIEIRVNIQDNLPPVMAEPLAMENITDSIVWFILNHNLISEVIVKAESSRNRVIVHIGCLSEDYLENPLEKFSQANQNGSRFIFNVHALALYNSWLKLKDCGGSMSIDLQEKSRIVVIFTVPIYKKEATLP